MNIKKLFVNGSLPAISYSILLLLTFCSLIILPAIEARAAGSFASIPVNKWTVCKDLGVGPVPGLSGTHYRIKLCHPKGWEILTYCTQPSLPPPQKNASCTRISSQAFKCGSGYQRLQLYRILAQPPAQETSTPTPTSTITPTQTNTPEVTQILASSTPVVIHRPKPGSGANRNLLSLLFLLSKIVLFSIPLILLVIFAYGYFAPRFVTYPNHLIRSKNLPIDTTNKWIWFGIVCFIAELSFTVWLSLFLTKPMNHMESPAAFTIQNFPTPTKVPTQTPFFPTHPTIAPLATIAPDPDNSNNPIYEMPGLDFSGIDFSDQKQWITIKIIPNNKTGSDGKLITMTFLPGDHCKFGTQRACLNTYLKNETSRVFFLSIHSGIGGEAESFRRIIEGDEVNKVSNSLDQIQRNLEYLQGSEVMIKQGDVWVKGFWLVATTRIPPQKINQYFKTPVNEILTRAATFNPKFDQLASSSQSLIVFETCGWRIPSEPWSQGVSDTTGSVYLGAIQEMP